MTDNQSIGLFTRRNPGAPSLQTSGGNCVKRNRRLSNNSLSDSESKPRRLPENTPSGQSTLPSNYRPSNCCPL